MKKLEILKGEGKYFGRKTGVDLIWVDYESVEDIDMDTVDPRNESRWRYQQSASRGVNWWGWRGGFEGLRTRMRDGWKEGAEKMERELSCVELPPVRSVKRRRIRGSYGDHLDIQRVYNGSLDTAWERTERYRADSIGSNNAVIVVEMKTAGIIDSDQVFWRGACAAMIADMLQRSGRNVKIVVNDTKDGTFSYSDDQYVMTVTVKDFDQPMDLETIAAATSVGFYRGYGFKAAHCQDRVTESSLGKNVFRTETVIPPGFINDNTLAITVEYDIYSREQAIEKLKAVSQVFLKDAA